MKKVLAGAAVISILVAGTLAFAHGPGGWGGHMKGAGYGRMMGPGPGGQMMGVRGPGAGPDQAFLNDTAELRQELHNKKFEYFEASRNPKTTVEDLSKLEKDMNDIKSKIREKATLAAYSGLQGHGRCR